MGFFRFVRLSRVSGKTYRFVGCTRDANLSCLQAIRDEQNKKFELPLVHSTPLKLSRILGANGLRGALLLLSFQACQGSAPFLQNYYRQNAPSYISNSFKARTDFLKAHTDFKNMLAGHAQEQKQMQQEAKKVRKQVGFTIGTACLVSGLYATKNLLDTAQPKRFGVVEGISLAQILFPPTITLIGGLIIWYKVTNFLHLQCKIDREKDANAFVQQMGEHKADILEKFQAYEHNINAAFSEQQRRAQHEMEELRRDNAQQIAAHKNIMEGYIHEVKEELGNTDHELKNTAEINKALKEKMEKVFPLLDKIQTTLKDIAPKRPTSPQPTPSRGGFLSYFTGSPRVASPSVTSPRKVDLT